MRTQDFDFTFPTELVAQTPSLERGQSRLMVLDRSNQFLQHRQFSELVDYLHSGDMVVLNDSRVLRARLWGIKDSRGARIELMLFEESDVNEWWALLRPGKRVRPGTTLTMLDLSDKVTPFGASVVRKNAEGHCLLRFEGMRDIKQEMESLGEIPLPPYINRRPQVGPLNDYERYQTVYAEEPGSVAAPTAGLHFTVPLLTQLQKRGVRIQRLTLHVGLGTFAPVKTDSLEAHVMHEEQFELSSVTADAIRETRNAGGRIVAVGTTTVRVLETVASANKGEIQPMKGRTRIFIYPPFRFQAVDSMITNFHLPRSTLLMLVSAFAAPNQTRGREIVLNAYAEAMQARYRFYSYGDAMLII